MHYFFANWKSYLSSLAEAEKLAEVCAGKNIIILPSVPHLSALSEKFAGQIILGAQDISVFSSGAFTGEVAGAQLFNLGVKYVLIGHSERREHFGESAPILTEKIMRAREAKIIPVICVGESEAARAQNRHEAIIREQIKELAGALGNDFLIAYEPIWAIGTGHPCSVAPAEEAAIIIIDELKKYSVTPLGVLYGGSVDETNLKEFWGSKVLAGVLVGFASANYDKMKAMVGQIQF